MKACLGIVLLMMPLLLFFNGNATTTNSSTANFSLALNNTIAYIERVNQSSYLVFYPNLQQAYAYASLANSTFKNGSAQAYALLSDARKSAAVQLEYINSYRTVSFYIMLVLTAASAVWLYRIVQGGKSKWTARSRK